MRRWSVGLLVILLMTALCRPAAAADRPTLAELVKGISRIAVKGDPGPVQSFDPAWSVIVAGDEDAAIPSGFVEARAFGKGRVIAIGHEGLLGDESLAIYETKLFLMNTLAWLAPPGRQHIAFSEGHGEYALAYWSKSLREAAEGSGYAVAGLPGSLSSDGLKGAGVLVIGNAWKAFTDDELMAVTQFVQEGGGLLLAGVGWSWHHYAPDSAKRVYPMDLIGAPFGIRWLTSVISDPTSPISDAVVFNTFYPAASEAHESKDFALLESLCAAHPKDLPSFLEKDSATAEQVRQALNRTASAVEQASDSEMGRRICSLSRKVARLCPQFLAAAPTLTTPTMLAVRDQFLVNWVRSRPFDETVKKEFADAARLKGTRLDIWNRYGIHFVDNNRLSEAQLRVVKGTLDLYPAKLHNFRFIGASFPGENAYADNLNLRINIFGDIDPGQMTESALPPDAGAGMIDTFSSALVHEMNHIIDFYTIENDPTLRARRNALRTAAGTQDLNYIRSQITAKFFLQYPLEFVASLSQAWSADSRKALALSLSRFDRGFKQPVNQVLFMAELYSQGGETTYFYRNDARGQLQRTEVPAARDEQGRIVRLTVDGVLYDFTLNVTGDVTAYRITGK